MSSQTRITASDGVAIDAWLAMPEGSPRGGLVVVQEAFGLTSYLRSVCEDYAREGYASIAPALYDRQQPGAVFEDESDPAALETARALRRGLRWTEVMLDIQAAIDAVRFAGRVGIVGFCVGGSVAWIAAQRLEVAAASCYYGRDVVDFLEPPPRCPVELHFGEHDHLIPLADVERVRAAFPALPVHVYPAAHGFDHPGPRLHADSARLARQRTLALLRAHVG